MDVNIRQLKDAFVFSPDSQIEYNSKLSSYPDPSSSRSQLAHIVLLKNFEDLGWVQAGHN